MSNKMAVAITHTTLSESEELELTARMSVAIGTKIRGIDESALVGNARRDTELLEQLGNVGGVAIVTYGKGNQRWLARVAPATPVAIWKQLRTLALAEMQPLPAGIAKINTMRSAIPQLNDSECELVWAEAASFKWGS